MFKFDIQRELRLLDGPQAMVLDGGALRISKSKIEVLQLEPGIPIILATG